MDEFFFCIYLILSIIAWIAACLKFKAQETGFGVLLTIAAIVLLVASIISTLNIA